MNWEFELVNVGNSFESRKPLALTVRIDFVALNDWLRQYAAENGYTYLDYYNALVDDKGLLKAGLFVSIRCHPHRQHHPRQ